MNTDRISNPGEVLSTSLMCFMVLALLIAPIYILVIGYRLNKAKLAHDRVTVKKYVALFEGKKIKSFLAVQYNTLFFLRRYCMMAMIVYWRESRNT